MCGTVAVQHLVGGPGALVGILPQPGCVYQRVVFDYVQLRHDGVGHKLLDCVHSHQSVAQHIFDCYVHSHQSVAEHIVLRYVHSHQSVAQHIFVCYVH